ncbi:MAG: hypothetical protein IKH22_06885 [Prevotella sp.]|nr:hypothetical protein [Prevotella sp.]
MLTENNKYNLREEFKPVIDLLKLRFPSIEICETECEDNRIVLMAGDILNWYLSFYIEKYSMLGINIYYHLLEGEHEFDKEWNFPVSYPVEAIVSKIKQDLNLGM